MIDENDEAEVAVLELLRSIHLRIFRPSRAAWPKSWRIKGSRFLAMACGTRRPKD